MNRKYRSRVFRDSLSLLDFEVELLARGYATRRKYVHNTGHLLMWLAA